MSIEELNKTIEVLEKERKDLFVQREPIDKLLLFSFMELNSMDIDVLTKEIEALEKERNDLFAQRQPIDDRIEANYKALEDLREQRGKLIVANLPKDEINIELILTAEHKSQTLFREAERQAQKLGLYRSGYFPATNQACFKLMLHRDKPESLEKTYNSVMFLLPHIKPHPDSEACGLTAGKKIFSIFEDSLSANGIYSFAILLDGKVEVHLQRYSRQSIVVSFPTIREGLKYVQKHLWYERDEYNEEE